MKTNRGLIQVLARQNKIKSLLEQGYPKSHIYREFSQAGWITVGEKRFYDILKTLGMTNAVLQQINFPGEVKHEQRVQPQSNVKIRLGTNQKDDAKEKIGVYKNRFPERKDEGTSFKRQQLSPDQLF